jgi:hypothetical protein
VRVLSNRRTGVTGEALQSAFKFTPADLVENRAGKLSATQHSYVAVQSKRGKTFNLAMGGVFVVFVIIIVTVVLPKMNSNSTGSSGTSSAVPPGVVFGVLAVVALLVALSLIRTRRGMERLTTGAVQSVEGPAKTRASARGNVDQLDQMAVMPVYRLTVGKVTFALSNAQQLGAFDEGVTYRCYYLKGTLPVLISAEQL